MASTYELDVFDLTRCSPNLTQPRALQVLKMPRDNTFGFHEYFHTSVLMGHVASILCDLRDVAAPCARCLLG